MMAYGRIRRRVRESAMTNLFADGHGFEGGFVGGRSSHRIGRHLRRSLRSHPILASVLLVAAAAAGVITVLALLVLAIVVAAAAGLGVIAYRTGRRLLRGEELSGRRRSLFGASSVPSTGDVPHRLLYGVEEFNELTHTALAVPIEPTGRRRRSSTLSSDARRLERFAAALGGDWRGSADIGDCLLQFRSAVDALARYTDALARQGSRRDSIAELRWLRDDLALKRDALTGVLRQTDFRRSDAVETPARR
ncbi:MAG: hypothetical protein ACR2PL_09130 [Dehalococcoidia bacterium]